MKRYEYHGSIFKFDEADVPEGAKLIEDKPAAKAAPAPKNKSRAATANKAPAKKEHVTDGDSEPTA